MHEARRAQQVQQQWRVFGGQQGRGIGGIAQGDDGARRLALGLQPLPGGLQQGLQLLGDGGQGACLGGRDAGLPGGFALGKNVGRQAEGRQQAPRRAVAHAGREGEAQPGGEFVALHGLKLGAAARAYSGLTSRSPTTTPRCACRMSA